MVSTLLNFFRNKIFSTQDDSYTFRLMYWGYTSPLGALFHSRMLTKAKEQYPKGHHQLTTLEYSDVIVTVVSFAYDNYSYILRRNREAKDCLIIDCGDAPSVLKVLNEFNWRPLAVLTTHKHWDHCYGNSALQATYPEALFVGGQIDRPNGCSKLVGDKETFEIADLNIKTHEIFGHTLGHVIYEVQPSTSTSSPLLFTGDTIFVAGVGKTFEGSNEQMVHSLDIFEKRFAPESLLFPGHEYALDGLSLARYLDPTCEWIRKRLEKIESQYLQGIPSVPSSLKDELEHNPFLRTSFLTNGNESIQVRAEKLVELRRLKEAYMGDRKTFDEEALRKRTSLLNPPKIDNECSVEVDFTCDAQKESAIQHIREPAFEKIHSKY